MIELWKSFPKWVWVIAICNFSVLLFELKVIFPIERSISSHYPNIVSLMFLPHAVRVLSTVIIGPKVFFVLFPTTLITGYFLYESYAGGLSLPLIIDAFSAAICAPIAYLVVKWVNRNNPAFELSLRNWQMVALIGVIASVANSIMRAGFLGHFESVSHVIDLVTKVIIGDMAGLAIGLLALVFTFRLIRRGQI
ncbi:MAG: hypothetical protein BA874_05800 [Desulfuromonadales bacterium C00003068]|jgi:hypothetical protein|nr:MAG: hypothetical protein BA874_05800 [Desulfuromonadales bacterium C00003068]